MRPRGVWASPLEPFPLVVVGSPAAAEALTLRDSAQQLQGGVWEAQARILIGACRDTSPHPSKGKIVSILMMVMIIWGGGMIVPLPPSLPNLSALCMQQAQRRKPWPPRPRKQKKKRKETPKPPKGKNGKKGQLPFREGKLNPKNTIFLMVLGTRGLSSAEITTFLDRKRGNCPLREEN